MLNNKKIISSNEEKLLGILLDSKLNFNSKLSLQKSRPETKCCNQVEEAPHIRSKKLIT